MQKVQSDPIHETIEMIYEAAIEPRKWPELLHALAELAEQSPAHHQRKMATLQAESGGNGHVDDVVMPHQASLYSVIANIANPENSEEPLDVKENGSETSKNEVNLILLNHFKRAIKIAKRLIDTEEQHEVVVSLLDHLPMALFVVDQDAVVLETNNQANQILFDKNVLLVVDGKLTTSLKADTKKLDQTIHDMGGNGDVGKRVVMGEGVAMTINDTIPDENDLMIFVTPITHNMPSQTTRIAVFVSSRKFQPVIIPKRISKFYGLTKKEVEITVLLVQGRSIKEISLSSGVTEHTVRSQVKSIFKKTNTRRQAELVCLVLTGPDSIFYLESENLKTDLKGSKPIFKGSLLPDVPKFFFLPDGRRMAYREYGDSTGTPLFYCHSLFGSRLELAFEGCQVAKERGLRLIIPDRPGIGCSDPRPDIGFLEWTEDLKALADFLEIDRFHVAGHSMGGQYALAAAFAMPERVLCLSLASVGLRPISEDDFVEMQSFYRFNLRLLKHVRPVYRLFSSIMRKVFFSNPESFSRQFGARMEGGDLKVFEDPRFRKMLITNITEGWRQGSLIPCREVENWMADDWGFDVESIKVPIHFWHGDRDHHVPCVLGRGLAKRLTRARLSILPDEGHMLFFSHWPRILDALVVCDPVVGQV